MGDPKLAIKIKSNLNPDPKLETQKEHSESAPQCLYVLYVYIVQYPETIDFYTVKFAYGNS